MKTRTAIRAHRYQRPHPALQGRDITRRGKGDYEPLNNGVGQTSAIPFVRQSVRVPQLCIPAVHQKRYGDTGEKLKFNYKSGGDITPAPVPHKTKTQRRGKSVGGGRDQW